MNPSELPARAAQTMVTIIDAIKPDQLDAPTPCREFDVRALISHLLHWSPVLEGAGNKQPTPAPDGPETGHTPDDWPRALESRVTATAAAWSVPEAWTGSAPFDTGELPAHLAGGMVLTELVIHGWDLAKATAQQPIWDPDLLAYLYEEVTNTAETGRQMGIYGPEVPVPAATPPSSSVS
ncbi:TIGR03086 family metal-binding protein, partial [Nocardia sp. JMUB6875]|uniref:TIGR03086 family metal-binding protein n=1 Tax=Nocardia sp. JMUB6875 TaxID=3158170 RepID=UPI0034E8B89A